MEQNLGPVKPFVIFTHIAGRLTLTISTYTREKKAYSWGVGEDESRDGLYCGFEGVVGAAVIGVQDTPGLEVRDDTFDEIADTIDGRVVSPVGVGEFTMGGFLHGGDHSQSDVALVPDMIVSIEGCEESGFLDGLCIVECNSL